MQEWYGTLFDLDGLRVMRFANVDFRSGNALNTPGGKIMR